MAEAKMVPGIYKPEGSKFTSGMRWFSIIVLVGWAAIILGLMSIQVFDADPPWQTAIAIILPIALYLMAMKTSGRFRDLIHATDPVLLSFTQSWRIIGILFLPMYVYGDLPGGFAWPTALGDIAIAIMAVFVPYAVVTGKIKLNSSWMWKLHILGILDLVIAVSCRVAFHATAMGQAPLVFIPAYLVPMWIIFHLMVIENMKNTDTSTNGTGE